MIGVIAGAVTVGIGLIAAVACPVAGVIAGGYYAATAASAAGMSTGAVWALGAAGVIGGGLLGRLAGTAVGLLSIPAGLAVGGTAALVSKLIGRAVGMLGGGKDEKTPDVKQQPPASVPVKGPKDMFDAKAAVTLKEDIQAPKLVLKNEQAAGDTPPAPPSPNDNGQKPKGPKSGFGIRL